MAGIRRVTPADLDRCFEIETRAYEGDEAATRDKIAARIAGYPEGFLVLDVGGQIAGFVNGACVDAVDMADENLKDLQGHDPSAPHVVIMSVAVDPKFQGKGHASDLMTAFCDQMRQSGKTSIHLMCRSHHVGLYEKLGFTYLRPSRSDHGGMAWHEMSLML